ncbi:sugar phosphate isomerase/epimerase family protein [Herbiconiux sp. SYSU D00978]|uniref:sugar phosphate isomerase/epimerase family protein n=1 Tax=Herbiconiux sp. SYSU D00978 TaxID=2812562 RepID=UPI001A95AB9A|nr:TIM barrel protein [Herbiconiux sp. SYSU D00978]
MIGTSTYAYFWRWSERAPEPMTLEAMLRDTAEEGAEVFQICDYPQIEGRTRPELEQLKTVADELGIVLELGTKGLRPDHLLRYLELAEPLGVTLVRSMVFSPDFRPSLDEAERLLREEILPAYSQRGVTLALETYEQIPSADLVALVERVGSEHLGICLDPANGVAGLEHPNDVIDRAGPLTVNIHSKDFAFSRRGGWVGFTLAGTEMGTGLLDYDRLLDRTDAKARGLSQVVEHWLPWTDDYETTARLEREWTTATLEYLRSKNND